MLHVRIAFTFFKDFDQFDLEFSLDGKTLSIKLNNKKVKVEQIRKVFAIPQNHKVQIHDKSENEIVIKKKKFVELCAEGSPFAITTSPL